MLGSVWGTHLERSCLGLPPAGDFLGEFPRKGKEGMRAGREKMQPRSTEYGKAGLA